MVRYGGWLLSQGGANKTHVAINRAWSRGRRRADNNGLVAGREKESGWEKERKRFPGTHTQSETEKGYFLVLHIGGPHSATVHPFVRKHSCTVIYRLNSYNVQFSVPAVEKHLARSHLIAGIITIMCFDYRCRRRATSIDLGYRLMVIELSLCGQSRQKNQKLRFARFARGTIFSRNPLKAYMVIAVYV